MSSTSGDDATHPQQILEDFWESLISKRPGKVTNIFPPSLYANLLPHPRKASAASGKNAVESYEAAAEECRVRVKHIVRECERTNEKFTDPEFDIETPWSKWNTLKGLKYWYTEESDTKTDGDDDAGSVSDAPPPEKPESVHRIDWIFDEPHFTVDGFDSSDVYQGANGDCWFIAAVATICSHQSLMKKVCVERNEECGVYGFVFFRDGEWVSTVVDDNLFLKYEDFDADADRYDPTGERERKWKKNEQTGSEALYFAQCADQNETWLPLLEKAFAKIHGDYDAIDGGWAGEAVEDLTGGVTTRIATNRILGKNRLWKELSDANKQFLFACSSPSMGSDDSHFRKGLALGHAYSIIKVVEEEDEDGKKHRLVLIRNPWGKRAGNGGGEWNGAWSDGSKEWTPYWMKKLNHKFGDDGEFWMLYDDVLKKFDTLERTRIFDKDWTTVQLWTNVSVAWVTGYLQTKFLVEIKKAGPTIFVLSQLDERYFVGLEGKYYFDLHFILQKEGCEAGDHIVRARSASFAIRSVSAEVDLEPGRYEVVPKIVAVRREDNPEVIDVVKQLADKNPQKLRQIGMNYDIANAKGTTEVTEEERKKREQRKKEKAEKKKQEAEEAEREKAEFEAWKLEKKEKEEKEKKEKGEKEKAEKTEGEEKKDGEKKDDEKKDDEKKDDEKKDDETKEGESKDDEKKEDTKTEEPKKAEDEKAEEKKEVPTIEEPKKEETLAAPVEEKKADTSEKNVSPKQELKSSKSGARKDDDAASVARSYAGSEAPNDGYGHPPQGYYGGPPSMYGDAPILGAVANPPPPPAPVDNSQKPWNAVCVLGLRVYSKDPEVRIQLIKPKNAEEGAVLDADGATQAGATI